MSPCHITLTLYKLDTSLRQTIGTSLDGVHDRSESWLYLMKVKLGIADILQYLFSKCESLTLAGPSVLEVPVPELVFLWYPGGRGPYSSVHVFVFQKFVCI